MITNINEYKSKITSGKLKLVNGIYTESMGSDDNFEDAEEIEGTEEIEDIEDIEGTEEETVMSKELLKDTLMSNFNNLETSEDEEIELPIMLSDEQFDVVYNTLLELGLVTEETEETEEEGSEGLEDSEDMEDIEDEEQVEELFKNVFKKITNEDDKSVGERREKLLNVLKPIEGKGFYIALKGSTDFIPLDNVETALDTVAKENNNNGMIHPKPVMVDGKKVFGYAPGNKGINKVGAGVGGASKGLGV